MKIKIENDLYDIVNRIKQIDDGYFVVFDDNKGVFEIHNSKQPKFRTYCLTVPYTKLDARVIDLLLKTDISNIDNIIDDIDRNNSQIDKNASDKRRTQTDYQLREIYEFANNSSKSLGNDLFTTQWR